MSRHGGSGTSGTPRRGTSPGSLRRAWWPRRGDLVAGVTVALVLVPQAIAYATLAGVPPVHGLYAAAMAPILAGVRGSSPYLQTGPVALTSLLTLGALAPSMQTGTEEYAAHAALLALIVGVTRLTVGLARFGMVAYLMSAPVVTAFTLAASLLILTSQLPALVGVEPASTNPLLAGLSALADPAGWNLVGLVVGLGVGAVTLAARRIHPLVPGALIGALGALALVRLAGIDVRLVGEIPAGIPPLDLDLPWSATPGLVLAGVVIAFVGFAEPASIARRYATEDRTRWSPDEEFVGQGLANVAAGAFAGYPVGGSFSRSSLNRLSGARTRWSGVVTGIAVLSVLPVVGFLSDLPRAALAGLIIAAVIPLLQPAPLLQMRAFSGVQFSLAAVAFAVTLLAAPRVEWGVLVGVVLSLVVHLWRELGLRTDAWRCGTELHVRPQGVLYFGSAPSVEARIRDEIASHPDLGHVLIHLDRAGRIDLTGALAMRSACEELSSSGIEVSVVDPQPQARRLMSRVFGAERVRYTDAPAGAAPGLEPGTGDHGPDDPPRPQESDDGAGSTGRPSRPPR